MADHDRLAIHDFVHRWWFHYDEGHLDVLAGMLADDCHLRSRTETGQHPHEEFIASDNRGRDTAVAWTKQHRQHSPYPLRHQASNVFVREERDDEVDVESYLFVTQIVDRTPQHALDRDRALDPAADRRRLRAHRQRRRARLHRVEAVRGRPRGVGPHGHLVAPHVPERTS